MRAKITQNNHQVTRSVPINHISWMSWYEATPCCSWATNIALFEHSRGSSGGLLGWLLCMMTSSNGFFCVTGPLNGQYTDRWWIPQRPVTRSFDVFFDLRLNKRLNKQSRRRWFETPWRSLWRHCNVCKIVTFGKAKQTLTCNTFKRHYTHLLSTNQ